MPHIEITRGIQKWPDRLRAYKVVIDGQVAGALRQGNTISIPVEPGSHEVWIRIDWCRSPAVSLRLDPGKTARLECAPNAPRSLLYLIYITIWRERYVSLKRVDAEDFVNPF
jgi:hypothetical protein